MADTSHGGTPGGSAPTSARDLKLKFMREVLKVHIKQQVFGETAPEVGGGRPVKPGKHAAPGHQELRTRLAILDSLTAHGDGFAITVGSAHKSVPKGEAAQMVAGAHKVLLGAAHGIQAGMEASLALYADLKKQEYAVGRLLGIYADPGAALEQLKRLTASNLDAARRHIDVSKPGHKMELVAAADAIARGAEFAAELADTVKIFNEGRISSADHVVTILEYTRGASFAIAAVIVEAGTGGVAGEVVVAVAPALATMVGEKADDEEVNWSEAVIEVGMNLLKLKYGKALEKKLHGYIEHRMAARVDALVIKVAQNKKLADYLATKSRVLDAAALNAMLKGHAEKWAEHIARETLDAGS